MLKSDGDIFTMSFVVTVGEHTGLVTGVAAGTATITASFVYDEVVYNASNSIEITVASSINYYDITFQEGSNVEGAGIELFIDKTGEEKRNIQPLLLERESPPPGAEKNIKYKNNRQRRNDK